MQPAYFTRHIRYAMIGIVVIIGLGFFAAGRLIDRLIELPVTLNYLFAFLFLFPFGFIMGLPFPLGMRYLFDSPEQRAYGWAVNGCASVLASIVSAQIALSYGISHILACGAASYLLALVCAERICDNAGFKSH